MRSTAGAFLAIALAVFAFATDAHAALVIHAKIEGMIDGGVAAYVERIVDRAEADTAVAILFEMDTYGGRVDAADEIRQSILNTDVLTITWIHSNAASAGGPDLHRHRYHRHGPGRGHWCCDADSGQYRAGSIQQGNLLFPHYHG